jgi:uncharacterized protein YyaL (SSP411 family)
MNRLATESSPYLLQHKDDPVDWYPWGAEAIAAAEAQNKPILLSIGYTACHWCHVMGRESFAEPEIAKVLNENFINVLVDREERPDVDQVYQTAANLMGHSGGWPLTAFLNPRGVPFVVGTYFPKDERAGQPMPFRQILDEVRRTLREQPDRVAASTEAVIRELNNLWHRDMRGPLDNNTLDSAAVRIGQRFDIFFGGMTGQPMKFPSVTLLEVMWRGFLRTGMPQFHQLTTTALDNMLLGGLYDHVGGGFCRYCNDERWTIPHWEKMLNDNAMILELMTSIWLHNRNSLCQTRIAETVEFLLRDMRNGDAFASSFDADSEGEEGKYYLWTEAEIDAALMGTFVSKFKTVYNVRRRQFQRQEHPATPRLARAVPAIRSGRGVACQAARHAPQSAPEPRPAQARRQDPGRLEWRSDRCARRRRCRVPEFRMDHRRDQGVRLHRQRAWRGRPAAPFLAERQARRSRFRRRLRADGARRPHSLRGGRREALPRPCAALGPQPQRALLGQRKGRL